LQTADSSPDYKILVNSYRIIRVRNSFNHGFNQR
jgi:hypothetical protein